MAGILKCHAQPQYFVDQNVIDVPKSREKKKSSALLSLYYMFTIVSRQVIHQQAVERMSLKYSRAGSAHIHIFNVHMRRLASLVRNSHLRGSLQPQRVPLSAYSVP